MDENIYYSFSDNFLPYPVPPVTTVYCSLRISCLFPHLKNSEIVIYFIIGVKGNMPAAQMAPPVSVHIGPCIPGICSSECQHR